MKKIALIGLALCLLIISTTIPAKAGPLPGLIAGSAGYLASGNMVAVGFNGYAGERLLIRSTNLDYSSTTGYCALTSYYSMGAPLYWGYTNQVYFLDIYLSDLYVWQCFYYSGLWGHTVLQVDLFSNSLLSNDAINLNTTQNLDEFPEELKRKYMGWHKQNKDKIRSLFAQ